MRHLSNKGIITFKYDDHVNSVKVNEDLGKYIDIYSGKDKDKTDPEPTPEDPKKPDTEPEPRPAPKPQDEQQAQKENEFLQRKAISRIFTAIKQSTKVQQDYGITPEKAENIKSPKDLIEFIGDAEIKAKSQENPPQVPKENAQTLGEAIIRLYLEGKPTGLKSRIANKILEKIKDSMEQIIEENKNKNRDTGDGERE